MAPIEIVVADITDETVDAIVTGVYGYPAEQAADIAIRTLTATPTKVETIRLIAYDPPAAAILEAAMRIVVG